MKKYRILAKVNTRKHAECIFCLKSKEEHCDSCADYIVEEKCLWFWKKVAVGISYYLKPIYSMGYNSAYRKYIELTDLQNSKTVVVEVKETK